MSTKEFKIYLHQLIDGISDHTVLQEVYLLLSKTSTNEDWFEKLSEDSKQKTLLSLKQSKKGEVLSHKSAMKQMSEKFPELKF
jgi:lipid A disaccharide synthetase